MLAILSLIRIFSLGGNAGYRYTVNKMWVNETIPELNKYVIDVFSQFFQSDMSHLSFGNIPSYIKGGYFLRAYQSEKPDYFGFEIG